MSMTNVSRWFNYQICVKWDADELIYARAHLKYPLPDGTEFIAIRKVGHHYLVETSTNITPNFTPRVLINLNKDQVRLEPLNRDDNNFFDTIKDYVEWANKPTINEISKQIIGSLVLSDYIASVSYLMNEPYELTSQENGQVDQVCKDMFY